MIPLIDGDVDRSMRLAGWGGERSRPDIQDESLAGI
jgi:hypothetical protein